MTGISISSERPARPALPDQSWFRFPANWLVNNPGTEGFFSKAIWFVLPFQYYVLTQFTGGFGSEAYVASAMVALISIAALFVVSCLFALSTYWTRHAGDAMARAPNDYGNAVRMWSIALIVTWATAHVVLAVSYFVGKAGPGKADIVHRLLCDLTGSACKWTHPNFGPQTIAEYFIYALIALALLLGARFVHRKLTWVRTSHSPTREPHILVVAMIVAGLMTLINGATTLPHSAGDTLSDPTAGSPK
jgi:hypothetical protein